MIFANNRDKHHPEIVARFREKKSEKYDFLILEGPKNPLAPFRFRSGPEAWLTMGPATCPIFFRANRHSRFRDTGGP